MRPAGLCVDEAAETCEATQLPRRIGTQILVAERQEVSRRHMMDAGGNVAMRVGDQAHT